MRKYFALLLLLQVDLPADTVPLGGRALDPTYYGVTSHEGRDQDMLDYFTLDTACALNRVSWYGQFSSGEVGMPLDSANFRVFLFHDNPDQDPLTYSNADSMPITVLPDFTAFYSQNAGATGVGTGLADVLQGGQILKWGLELDGLVLDAGTYWLSISATSDDPGYFLWNRGQSPSDIAFFGEVGDGVLTGLQVTPEHCAMAWELEGAVSVPDSTPAIWLFVPALLALVTGKSAARWRRKTGQDQPTESASDRH